VTPGVTVEVDQPSPQFGGQRRVSGGRITEPPPLVTYHSNLDRSFASAPRIPTGITGSAMGTARRYRALRLAAWTA
jgi:hypothetical protein